MIFLRSLLFNLYFIGSAIVILGLGMPALLGPKRGIYFFGHLWSNSVLRALKLICGITQEIRGLDRVPAGACLIASKHQSSWDTLIFERILGYPCYVVKEELMGVPIYGLYLRRVGHIPVNRQGGVSTLKAMVRDARRETDKGRRLIIYPEGTRTNPGESPPYHPGVAALYSQLDLPVVPVALNSGMFWGRRAFVKRPGRLILEFLPPIPPGLPRRVFMDQLRERIETASKRLSDEATGTGTAPSSDGSCG